MSALAALLPDLGRRTLIMAVLNVTPDSFSDGGDYATVESAVARGREMAAQGADILDIGGESTRPATFGDRSPLPSSEEMAPGAAGHRAACRRTAELSSLHRHLQGGCRGGGAGLRCIDHQRHQRHDPRPSDGRLVAARQAPIILMHLLGSPRNIPVRPVYADVVAEIRRFWELRIEAAVAAGVRPENVLLDPGIGFGKTAAHNLEILRRLAQLTAMGFPVVVGASRKRFLGRILNTDDPRARLEGTAATVALSIAAGAAIVRVHDVAEMSRVAKVGDAIVRGWDDAD